MKSLNFVLKNKKMALILYIQDLTMFLLFFVPFLLFLKSTTKGNYYSIHLTADYFADILPYTGGITAFIVLIVFFVILYLLTRLFLLAGIFEKLKDEGVKCLANSKQNFWKFSGLWVIYLFIFLALSAMINLPLKKVIENTVNLQTAYYLKNLKIMLTVFLTIIVSLFHNSARVKTIVQKKFKPFAKPEKVLPFFGYQLLAIFTTVLGVFIFYKIITINNYITFFISFIVLQAAIFLKITLKLASYKTLF